MEIKNQQQHRDGFQFGVLLVKLRSMETIHTISDNTTLPVDEVLGLLACADQLNNSVKHLCTVRFLLLFKHKHEVVAEACLHHNPVNCSGQVNVSSQENNVFTCMYINTDQMISH